MKLAIIGRTELLLSVAKALSSHGHEVVLVATARPEPHYGAGPDDFAAFAAGVGAHYQFDPNVNSADFIATLSECGAEVGVSINWPRLFKAAVLEALPHGILNSHTGDLQRYRGNACPNWAILAGERHVAICIHAMYPGALDAGPIYARRTMELTDATYINDVYEWQKRILPSLWLEALDKLTDPDFVPEPQEGRGRPLRTYPRRHEDALIDWTQGASEICRLVRASSRPFAGAFSYLEGLSMVTIWRAHPAKLDSDILAVPGQVVGRGRVGPIIACGKPARQALEVEDYDVEGREPLPTHSGVRLANPRRF